MNGGFRVCFREFEIICCGQDLNTPSSAFEIPFLVLTSYRLLDKMVQSGAGGQKIKRCTHESRLTMLQY